MSPFRTPSSNPAPARPPSLPSSTTRRHAPEGYRTLARLRAAGLKADAGDVPGAVALWNAVAADRNADPLLRDLASLLATERELDHGDPAQLEARLKPLAELGNPWSTLAEEQLAMLDLRQGKVEDARKKLQVLSFDSKYPDRSARPRLRPAGRAWPAGCEMIRDRNQR